MEDEKKTYLEGCTSSVRGVSALGKYLYRSGRKTLKRGALAAIALYPISVPDTLKRRVLKAIIIEEKPQP